MRQVIYVPEAKYSSTVFFEVDQSLPNIWWISTPHSVNNIVDKV